MIIINNSIVEIEIFLLFQKKSLFNHILLFFFASQSKDWQGKDCDEEVPIWEDNWDDDDIEDDFAKQLKLVSSSASSSKK